MTTTNFSLCIFCLCLLTSCSKGEKKTNEPVRVKVAEAEMLVPSAEREFSFIAKPFKETELSFRVGGPIDRFEVYAGNYYHRGDIIAEIDSRDFRIRKERAEAIYHQAKAEFERIKVLYEKNNLSASAYEKARADYTSAKTAYETAVNELEDTKLIAPFDGYIGEVYIEKYQDVKATQSVVSFIDITQLKIEAYVTQEIAFQAKEIKEVGIRFDVRPEAVYPAKVIQATRAVFWVVFDVTKKVTVLIFAIFCPRGLEGGRQSGPRGGGSRAAKQKRGRRLSCVPVLGRYSFPAAEFTPLRRTASCTGRRRSRPGRAVRRVCPSRRCRRRGSPRSRRRYGSWTGGAR